MGTKCGSVSGRNGRMGGTRHGFEAGEIDCEAARGRSHCAESLPWFLVEYILQVQQDGKGRQ